MKNEMLKSTLFLHADTLMLDWCINSVTQAELEDHLELHSRSVQQPSPTENIVRRVYTHATLDG